MAFISRQEKVDATPPQGELASGMMANLARFEGALIGERVRAGMARAEAQGNQADRQGARDRVRDGLELRRGDEGRSAGS